MTSENKTCPICLGSVETGQGQAIFTAECSHFFHFSCITISVAHGNRLCPVCRATWTNLPFVIPNSNNNATNPVPFNQIPDPVFQLPQPQPLARHRPVIEPEPEPEPVIFSDDEPLPVDPMSIASTAGLQNVAIKAIPEQPAIAAAEFVPHFSVLVGIRAPPLSENARHMLRAPVDLVMVLDVSGSMHGAKLALLKRAVNFVIDSLGPSDRLSIVSFSTRARRVLSLRRMTESGREDAKRAVSSLLANGTTNIVEGLKKGVQVLEERHHHRNPVASIMFLSDGRDTCNHSSRSRISSNLQRQPPHYLHMLPTSICPSNRGTSSSEDQEITFPVHAFGFGTDHDSITMHTISDSSGGTFSFIESYEIVQDAFASCIGGLLSVVTQELRIMMTSASHGVEIKSIPSGRYVSEISNQESRGTITVGDLYADEEKEFLINLSIPILENAEDEENQRKTPLLDITCSYKDVVSNGMVKIENGPVEVRRPEFLSPQDMIINLEVDRQRNRINAAESIAEAQRMAERGDLSGARALLSNRRSHIRASASGVVGDGLCNWLEGEMRETEQRMGSRQIYNRAGRAYALSNMSSHCFQRASTRGMNAGGALENNGGHDASYVGYLTPNMASMVNRSQLRQNKSENANSRQE